MFKKLIIPMPTSKDHILNKLKPLSKIDPKDQRKKKIDEVDESEKLRQTESLAENLQDKQRGAVPNRRKEQVLHIQLLLRESFHRSQRLEAITTGDLQPRINKKSDDSTYIKHIKRSTEDFIAIGSVEDEGLIKKMKKKDSSKGEENKQESKEEVKQEDKEEENTRKRKQGQGQR
ncbi:hypothetical protein Tco_0948879 [Tanacetum coccineum]